MGQSNEVRALKASFRGAVSTAEALGALLDRMESLEPDGNVDPGLLEDLRKVATAHAIASNALRSLLETMIRRREEGA